MFLKQQLYKLNLLTFMCLNLFSNICTINAENNDKPNIVIILADDLGFDDVSFRGSNRFLTPNIDALAYNGVILKNLYTPAMCTPSRSALLTGKYPISNGMQHYVIVNDQPWSLPLNETTIAEVFHKNGYYTSLLGKWHLGLSRKAYTPTLRGFQHHFGCLGAYVDYYKQTYYNPNLNYTKGHDFRLNLRVSHDYIGTYMTDLLTDAAIQLIDTHDHGKQPLFLLLSHLAPHTANAENPLQAPADEIEKFLFIKDMDKRTYAAMVSRLDNSVGRVIDALAKKQILNNTIILFLSDNGGPTVGENANTASNYPLRGQKNSPWEGGIRSSAAIWSTKIDKLSTVWKQRVYMADFFPTLAAAAGIYLDEQLQLDGLNLWSALKYGYQSVEREIVHNIDELIPYTAYMKGKWKLINGTTENGTYDQWLGRRSTAIEPEDPRALHYEELIRNTSVWKHLQKYALNNATLNISALRIDTAVNCQFMDNTMGKVCQPLLAPCLFDVDVDPCEQNNLYDDYHNVTIFLDLLKRLETYRRNAHKPNNKPKDVDCNPLYYNNEWTWWQDATKSNGAITTIFTSWQQKQYLIIFILYIIRILYV